MASLNQKAAKFGRQREFGSVANVSLSNRG
jgi:hypothetical protein